MPNEEDHQAYVAKIEAMSDAHLRAADAANRDQLDALLRDERFKPFRLGYELGQRIAADWSRRAAAFRIRNRYDLIKAMCSLVKTPADYAKFLEATPGMAGVLEPEELIVWKDLECAEPHSEKTWNAGIVSGVVDAAEGANLYAAVPAEE